MISLKGIGWVETRDGVNGRDHLGIQAQSVHVYSQLFDAITNITPRARYFSFYCWLVKWLIEVQPREPAPPLRA